MLLTKQVWKEAAVMGRLWLTWSPVAGEQWCRQDAQDRSQGLITLPKWRPTHLFIFQRNDRWLWNDSYIYDTQMFTCLRSVWKANLFPADSQVKQHRRFPVDHLVGSNFKETRSFSPTPMGMLGHPQGKKKTSLICSLRKTCWWNMNIHLKLRTYNWMCPRASHFF